jgi:hypothetical protein
MERGKCRYLLSPRAPESGPCVALALTGPEEGSLTILLSEYMQEKGLGPGPVSMTAFANWLVAARGFTAQEIVIDCPAASETKH